MKSTESALNVSAAPELSVVTSTATLPELVAELGGLMQTTCVWLMYMADAGLRMPNWHLVVPVLKPVPTTVTRVPPACGPFVGWRLETRGPASGKSGAFLLLPAREPQQGRHGGRSRVEQPATHRT